MPCLISQRVVCLYNTLQCRKRLVLPSTQRPTLHLANVEFEQSVLLTGGGVCQEGKIVSFGANAVNITVKTHIFTLYRYFEIRSSIRKIRPLCPFTSLRSHVRLILLPPFSRCVIWADGQSPILDLSCHYKWSIQVIIISAIGILFLVTTRNRTANRLGMRPQRTPWQRKDSRR
jgi:hypothetical protein